MVRGNWFVLIDVGMDMIELVLPWPPSANAYYRHPSAGRFSGMHLISEKGREFREAVRLICLENGVKPISGRLHVNVRLFPPDKRKRDVDNSAKSLLDSLTHGGCWEDDSQIDLLHIERHHVIKGGVVHVCIKPLKLDPLIL